MDKQYEWVTMFEGVRRRIVADGKNVMQVKIELRKGTSVPRHRHEHEQISFIHSGRCRFDLDGRIIIAGPGDTILIPSMVWHAVETLEDAVALDTFSPPRDDFRSATPPDPAIYGR